MYRCFFIFLCSTFIVVQGPLARCVRERRVLQSMACRRSVGVYLKLKVPSTFVRRYLRSPRYIRQIRYLLPAVDNSRKAQGVACSV